MAQAARLNLRMQKELKLLITDPPPGASFPTLSPTSDLSSFSLTAIDAQIEGPEGTVYEKGVFKIKVQIPERYPFQPPIVTFSTPIYHPNIDTGGRICLDILNLPPKGAWQPSLNISTVLTSIGLLLSEPNPDDGLMCEASREYKYNKQVFDQKARSMTEKHARSEASPNHAGLQVLTDSSMTEDKPTELAKIDTHEYAVDLKKLSGTNRKLSLDASGSNTKEVDTRMNEAPSNTIHGQSQIQERKQDSKDTQFKYVMNPQSIPLISSTNHYDQFPDQPLDHHQDHKPTVVSSTKLCLSGKNTQAEILASIKRTDDPISSVLSAHNDLKIQKEATDRSCLSNPKRKKLGLTGKKPSFGFSSVAPNRENDKKWNMGSGGSKGKLGEKGMNTNPTKLPRKPLQVLEEKHTHDLNLTADAEILRKSGLKHDGERSDDGILEEKEGLCDSEGVIVLDSEDSEEETSGSLNSRRLIARKRLLGKR
ncbi:uncharacterized protein LOC112517332 [Cynara cardunculus var. scolymus]|uniref:uncharacterized protein LOC112517332 n=1 Tax=Cynara cardunculus var. scolymus TaxID=59895 RepID=UPI000D62D6B3|nr:uncharacterized protein LOC112517332 [Cynara cardunculus var. scolymus]